ncbi:hypothetical protein [Paraburkholderia phenoliruptrix]|uniref:Uncharacterized protein n=1 Tax=Burkholderia sp. (strain CCGE1003) TaxID=640512 RepID=E1T3E7_BURSG|nr:hypothetical protein [Paraburkholderia phenoliruptrix]MBW9103829.1 hypothetical protein [Paraburkholderia phenoliruptrix]MBW9131983.1 hypothetical protein [Paraburkholderia ginsengiterrae]
MDANIITQAKAFFKSASIAAEACVVARYGEFDIFKEKHCAAYDAALFPLLAEYFGEMTLDEVLSIVG